MNLTDELKREAYRLGFQAVGIAPVEPSPRKAFVYEWLARGYHGTMAYLARDVERRLNPALVFPGARSIICLATLYRTREIPSELAAKRSRGLFSRYAWGDDYHDLLFKRTSALLDWLRVHGGPNADGRVYVDTGPLLERELAARAGIGWIGKNTLLLNRRLGSYFFLSEILTNVALEPDAPVTDRCGSCRRCLDACPTQAFPEPYVLDASKCLSYLTIELKGEIPEELRPLLGKWVFGCDVCQEVCPWNRKAPFSGEGAFAPRPGLLAPKLSALMALTAEGFRRIFRNSPVKRAKRVGLLRNVAVALGNSRDPKALPALKRGLNDPEPLIRLHSAWALGEIGGKEAFETLSDAAASEAHPDVRSAIEKAWRRGSVSEKESKAFVVRKR